ncbi:hypothetical protein B0H13DRAFT_2376769 [Mycena leptocephala]|nr:hypothetical protein B0H13DRAFT_2376769 [Mycena leptocephala]
MSQIAECSSNSPPGSGILYIMFCRPGDMDHITFTRHVQDTISVPALLLGSRYIGVVAFAIVATLVLYGAWSICASPRHIGDAIQKLWRLLSLLPHALVNLRLSSYAYHSPYTYSLALDPPTLDLVEAVRLVAPHAYRCTNIHTHSGDARVLPLILQHIAPSLNLDPPVAENHRYESFDTFSLLSTDGDGQSPGPGDASFLYPG